MDDRRFDSLTRLLASGVSRRAMLRSLLGLSSAAVLASEVDARTIGTRPTLPPPPPPPSTTTTTPKPTTTTPDPCPPPNVKCGLECCSDDLHCCDKECCAPNAVCLTKAFYGEVPPVEEEVCCLLAQTCDGQCCDGDCFWPVAETNGATEVHSFHRTCCSADEGVTFCAGEGAYAGNGACCSGETPHCCHDSAGRPVCLTEEQCCTGDECPDRPDFCEIGVCLPDFSCGFVFNCEAGDDCCKGGDNVCCALPNECCVDQCCTPDTPCCGESCCDPDQCNEIDDVCCPAETYRCGTGEDACCPDDLQCCLPGKVCGECCGDDDCSDIVDFPNCKRSRCDAATHTCQLYDVCEEEGRTCCPGEDVGSCQECCSNDDCPGCDACLLSDTGNHCAGGCRPTFLNCCDLADDPDEWFCYHPDTPEACPIVCAEDSDCANVNDFPNCRRSRCDVPTGNCVFYDVCVDEGRTCCPGEDVGSCQECCSNDDCPGCDACLLSDTGNHCAGGCRPTFLNCCDLADDPDEWFCYHPNIPEACPIVCAEDSDCANVNDFPNCLRSRCDVPTGNCVFYDVCVEEGRICCPGEDVGFCYSTENDQCCANVNCTADAGETCSCQNRECVCEPISTVCEGDLDCASIPTYCETDTQGRLLWRYHLCSGNTCTLTAHPCNFANHICERNTCGDTTDCGVEPIPPGGTATDGLSICCNVDNDCATLPRFCDDDDLFHYSLCGSITCQATAQQCSTGQCDDIIGCQVAGP